MSLVKHNLLDKETGGMLNKAFHVYMEAVCNKELSKTSLCGVSGKKHSLISNMKASCELLNKRTTQATSSMTSQEVEVQIDQVDGELIAKHYTLNKVVSLFSRSRTTDENAATTRAYLTLNGSSVSPNDDCKVKFIELDATNYKEKSHGIKSKFNFLKCKNNCQNNTPSTNLYRIVGRRGRSTMQLYTPTSSITGNINSGVTNNNNGVLAISQCGPYITLRQVHNSLTVTSSERYIGIDDQGQLIRVDSKLDKRSQFSII